jgi:fructoselysine-6-P-deglycase FrlB-like protein
MLTIDKDEVHFLVTEHMVKEVEDLLANGWPKIDRVVEEMRARKIDRVYYVGCGSCLGACQTAEILFQRYSRIPCKAFGGSDFADQPPAQLDGRTAVVGISHAGATEDVVQAISIARAMTVAVTQDLSRTPLAEAAEHIIDYNGECIWEMHLIVAYYLACKFIVSVEANQEIDTIVADMRRLPKVLSALLQTQEERSKGLALRASEWPFIYTVASGVLYPFAYKEGIITMMEFTWTHGCVLSAGEFRHGPFEVAEKGVPYVFLVGTDESRPTVERALRFVETVTDDWIVFDCKALNAGLHPMLDPLILFVPLEYFYYYLSLGKGHNPDDRRYYGGLVDY